MDFKVKKWRSATTRRLAPKFWTPLDSNAYCNKLCAQISELAVDEEIQVADYKISNKGAGEDGLGVANLIVKWNERNFHGYGVATDVIEASGQAFVSALNAIQRAKQIAQLREERKANS